METHIQDSLLAEIEAYLLRTRTSATTLSIAATGGWAAVSRIRKGGNPNAMTMNALRRVMFDRPTGVRGVKDAYALRRIAKNNRG